MQWKHDMDRLSNEADKYAYVDKMREEWDVVHEHLSTLESGMKGVSLVENTNLMGSTVDEIMYKTHLYPSLNQLWRSYLIFIDKQKYHDIFHYWQDKDWDGHILNGALATSSNKQELIEFENSLAWKNYFEKHARAEEDKNVLVFMLNDLKKRAGLLKK
jgi:hypothetical protein